MQCVVLSATCGGSLAAYRVARRTASSAVRSDAAYQWIPHDGPAALRGMDAGAQTFVCARSALRRWTVALRLHGMRRSDAVTRREHGRAHVAGEDTVRCDEQQDPIVGAVAASGTSHVPQHNGVCGPEAREEGGASMKGSGSRVRLMDCGVHGLDGKMGNTATRLQGRGRRYRVTQTVPASETDGRFSSKGPF
ncbi:unnamed protein product [Hyaloperonospora brassicae]|uniref:RxLR effector candidate protein n=1 Tax=Hyaloperonospora brassicae TaxID=162125 RepID=A0AAV0TBP8_HYABA|nr:unnamed protein product [Hyaloperonospora brassicae]